MFYLTKTNLFFLIREKAKDFWRFSEVENIFEEKLSAEKMFSLECGLLPRQFGDFPVSKTFEVMIVHHSDGLHE